MPGLHDLQREFARELRRDVASDKKSMLRNPAWLDERGDIDASDRLGVYANNARQFFRAALELTYPVLRKRVGEDYFRQLAREYRDSHPSRYGDLHWVGVEFPGWLARRMDSTEYAWLADLARLEWACEAASVAPESSPLAIDCVGLIPAERLDSVVVRFQPSLSLVESRWPVWSVWHSNQGDVPGQPVDLATGSECCACRCFDGNVVVYRVEPEDFALLRALHDGRGLALAVDEAGVDAEVLARVLGWAFAAGLVIGFSPSDPA